MSRERRFRERRSEEAGEARARGRWGMETSHIH